jgi:penicillin-binding protein 1A
MTSRVQRYLGPLGWLCLASVCGMVLTLASIFLYLNPKVPTAETYRHYNPEAPFRVYTHDGALFAEFGERRLIPVGIETVPRHFINGLLNTEDKRFYEHDGIDYISLVNDTWRFLLNPEIRTGASTITMQLAKTVSFSLEQTFIRKFKEMLLAIKIERELTKNEILELYINVMPFGKRAYGAQAAAYTYYGKPLSGLDLAQLAMLAGVLKRPEGGNPINGPDWALRRRNLVLQRMFEQGTIHRAAFYTARSAPITAKLHRRELDLSAPYAAEWVRAELVKRFGQEVYGSGYEVYTTIDAAQQVGAKKALQTGLINYDRRHGYRGIENHIDSGSQTETDATQTESNAENKPSDLESIDSPVSKEMANVFKDTSSNSSVIDQNARFYLAAMENLVPVSNLIPAVVTELDTQTFNALTYLGEPIVIEWGNMKWARQHIDANTRGPALHTAADIVTIGDIVRVDRSPEGTWRLAQIPQIQGALVAMKPSDGAVTALVGGFDFWRNQYNHALQAARQPGSGFKPFVYSAAIADGLTAATIFLDAPLVFNDANLETIYRPKNDSGRYNGPTRLREALYRSINLVSMRVLIEVSAGKVLDHAQRFGFDINKFPRNTQLAIGGGTMGVTPIDMASAYAVLANGGYMIQPHIIDRIETRDGKVVFEARHPEVCDFCGLPELTGEIQPIIPAVRTIDERNVFIINSILQDVIKRGTGRKALVLERSDLAGKTGTTDKAADTWFNGYTKDLVATVWIGFDDYRPVGDNVYGSNTPLPIWIEFMRGALDGVPEKTNPQPEGIITMKIDPETGRLARPGQDSAIFEYFLSEHPPSGEDDRRPNTLMPNDQEVAPEDIF